MSIRLQIYEKTDNFPTQSAIILINWPLFLGGFMEILLLCQVKGEKIGCEAGK